jgi:hypothetical protein
MADGGAEESMSEWLEFHDSILTAIRPGETHVELLLDAYIHRWERVNDDWRGTGCCQRVRITMTRPVAVPAAPLLPVAIADGGVQLDAITADVVRLPFDATGAVRVWLQLITADVLELSGGAVRLEGAEPARYVEDLPAEMRPKQFD